MTSDNATSNNTASDNTARDKKDKRGRVAVIDGQGGGIGRALVDGIKAAGINVEVIALGTNSAATAAMVRAGADEGATGENAIVYNAARVDIIVGVIAILSANALLGEVSPRIAEAIGASEALKLLIPLNRCGIKVIGAEDGPMGAHIENAIEEIKKACE